MGSQQLNVVDIDLALERAGGNADLARELYQMLQKELPEYQEKLQTLFNTNDYPALTQAVHKLHGSATYCGVPALKAASEFMESSLKRGDEAQYQQGMQELQNAIAKLLEVPSLAIQ